MATGYLLADIATKPAYFSLIVAAFIETAPLRP